MKRLVIHIGYPKTGSTSLQEGLFLPLHEQGRINYLGRTQKSTHVKLSEKKFNDDISVQVRKHIFKQEALKNRKIALSDKLVNIISDEDLTLAPFLNKVRFGKPIDPLDFIGVLKELFDEAEDIKILLTIRNQGDLVNSCFLQKYRYFYRYQPDFSFDDFIGFTSGVFNYSDLKTFDFGYVASKYELAFKAPVYPLIFEDLLFDKQSFFEQLSRVTAIAPDELGSILGNQIFRNKNRKGHNQITVYKLTRIGKLTEQLLGQKRARAFFDYRWYLRNSFWISKEEQIFLKKINVPSPVISQDQKDFIVDSFRDSNRAFIDKYKLDFDKMKAYKYFR